MQDPGRRHRRRDRARRRPRLPRRRRRRGPGRHGDLRRPDAAGPPRRRARRRLRPARDDVLPRPHRHRAPERRRSGHRPRASSTGPRRAPCPATGTWYGMCMFSERTQVLLSPEQLARLKRIAARDGRSVGAVIREAVDFVRRGRARQAAARAQAIACDERAGRRLGGHEGADPEEPARRLVTAFIDTAVIMYAAGGDHAAPRAIATCPRSRIGTGDLDGVISVEVIQEILHRFISIRRLGARRGAGE